VPQAEPPTPSKESEAPALNADDEIVKVSPIRRRIAERLVRSKSEAPHVTTMLDVDMTRVVELRKQHRDAYEKDGIKLTYMPFILQAVARGLLAFPMVNSSWAGDTIIVHHRVHIGLAVSLEKGLAVPVIRDADRKSLRQLAESVQSLATRARSGRLSTDELQGGTFTVTNPGSFGGMLSTPIINPPEAAILAVERIAEAPAVRNGKIVIASIMNLCLSYDHRLIDGETAIRFLQHVRGTLEKAEFEL
jgi:2-oxoisovalerate dehydrogenase E2 component (dihydrolipoyl transacylase)